MKINQLNLMILKILFWGMLYFPTIVLARYQAGLVGSRQFQGEYTITPPTTAYPSPPKELLGFFITTGGKSLGLEFQLMLNEDNEKSYQNNDPSKIDKYTTDISKSRLGLNLLKGGKRFLLDLRIGVDRTQFKFVHQTSDVAIKDKPKPDYLPYAGAGGIVWLSPEVGLRFGVVYTFINYKKNYHLENQIGEAVLGLVFPLVPKKNTSSSSSDEIDFTDII
jgi:hypothetical protein